MARAQRIIVTVTDEALDRIEAVAEELAAKGMKIDRVLSVMGVISGSCPPGKKDELQAVPGVHSVEDEAEATASS
jgi:hypothetical protein